MAEIFFRTTADYEYKILRYRHVTYKPPDTDVEYDLVPDGKQVNLTEEEFKEIVKLMNVGTTISFDTKVVLAIHNKLKELL